MEKVSITIDLAKIDKSRINERTYTNKEGKEVTVKEYKMDVVKLREPKAVADKEGKPVCGDGWQLMKTHFVAQHQTKEEREGKAETVFLGDGVTFENLNEPAF